jgi:hypothetical protein
VVGRVRFQLRRGTAAEWASKNPLLLEDEPGFESNTGRYKFGDGLTLWNDLDYVAPESTVSGLDEHIVSPDPHPEYDDGTSLLLRYQNAKV